MPLVVIPVVGEFLITVAHARFILDQLVSAGSDARRRVVHTAIRLDDEVIVGDKVGKVRVRRLQVKDHIVAVGGDAVDAAHDAQRAGLRFLAGMALHGRDDIVHGHGLAVVELDALADLEPPGLGVGRCFDAFRHAHDRLARGGNLDQRLTPVGEVVIGDLARRQGRILRVGAFAADRTNLQVPALLRPSGLRRIGEKRVRRSGGQAQRRGAAKEIAPVQRALRDFAAEIFQLIHLVLLPVFGGSAPHLTYDPIRKRKPPART